MAILDSTIVNGDLSVNGSGGNIVLKNSSETQTISIPGTTTVAGGTVLTLKTNSTSSYLGFSNTYGVQSYIGVNANRKPVFYDTAAHTLAYVSDILALKLTWVADVTLKSNLKTIVGGNGNYLLLPLPDAVRIYNTDTLALCSSYPVSVSLNSYGNFYIVTGQGAQTYVSISSANFNVNTVRIYQIG